MKPTNLTAGVVLLAALVTSAGTPAGSARKFFADDPLGREPETQDASAVQPVEIDLFLDLALNLFGKPGDPQAGGRARNVNTIDEVPDSSWFTNRIGARSVAIADAVRGPLTGDGPAPGPLTVVRPKSAGFAPGFTMQDSKGTIWFVSFDAKGHPEAATGAILVANRIFWTLGYWQVENYLIAIRPEQLTVSHESTVRPPSGIERRMKPADLDAVFRRAHRDADGSYRAIAARAVPGKPLGGFRYHGTRSDDPNDVIPHEHRRELRALQVFGAWTNLVDMKAGNTLDALVTVDGRRVVRHYLQDVGSTFGTGANGPREYPEGWEPLYDGGLTLKRLVTLGFYLQPWQTVQYVDSPAIGRFEGSVFKPREWRPRVPTAALRHARADDLFWAARRVIAFSDEMIRAVVNSGGYSDPAAATHLADVLIERRDRIGLEYLTAVNPVVDFRLDADGRLVFDNIAVATGLAKPPGGGYLVRWFTYDNNTGATAPIGSPTVTPTPAARLSGPIPATEFLKLEVSAIQPEYASWTVPVDVYFKRTSGGWMLIGLDRVPAEMSAVPPQGGSTTAER